MGILISLACSFSYGVVSVRLELVKYQVVCGLLPIISIQQYP